MKSACIFSSEDTDQLCRGEFCTHLASVLSSQTQGDQLFLVFFTKPTLWISTIMDNICLIVSRKQTLVLGRKNKPLSFPLKSRTS